MCIHLFDHLYICKHLFDHLYMCIHLFDHLYICDGVTMETWTIETGRLIRMKTKHRVEFILKHLLI